MKSIASDQLLSFQAWALFRLRFIISAEVCAAWELYGGVIAPIDNLGATLNIAVSDNVGIALKYFDFLHAQLESYARSRATGIDYFQLLSEGQHDIIRRFTEASLGNEGSSGTTNFGKNSGHYVGDIEISGSSLVFLFNFY